MADNEERVITSQDERPDEPVESEEIKVAKEQTALLREQAEQAKLQDEAHKAKIEMELRAKGFADLKAFGEYLKAQKEETDNYCEKKIAEANATLGAAETQKAEAQQLLVRVKVRDTEVNKRLQEAIVSEQITAARDKEAEAWKAFLYINTRYHDNHIIPCRQALERVSKLVYTWSGWLMDNCKKDTIPFTNKIGDFMTEIDKYIDHTKAPIPEGAREVVGEMVREEKERDKEFEGLLK